MTDIAEALGASLGKRAGRKIGVAIAKALAEATASQEKQLEHARQQLRGQIAASIRERQRRGFETTEEIYQALGEIANDIERGTGHFAGTHLARMKEMRQEEKRRITAMLRKRAQWHIETGTIGDAALNDFADCLDQEMDPS